MNPKVEAFKTLYQTLTITEKAQLIQELNSSYEKETASPIQMKPQTSRKQQIMEMALLLNEEAA